MRITRLELTNWMLFAGEHAIDLPGGAIAVVGRYAGEAGRSNWSGKTSLLESIEWALYGVHRKRYEDDVIHNGAAGCAVTVALGDVRVTRKRKRGKSTVLSVAGAGEDVTGREAQSRVIELLGMDHADFRATLCVSQDDTLAIVSRTSGERRKLIAQWLELDAWARACARVVNDRNATRKRLETLRMSHGHVATQISNDSREILSDEDLGVLSAAVDSADADVRRLSDEFATVNESMRLWEARERVRELADEARDLRERIASESSGDSVDAGAIGEELGRLNSERSDLLKSFETAKALSRGEFDGECPLTRDTCPVAAHVLGRREQYLRDADSANAELTVLGERARGLRESAREAEQCKRALTSLRERYNAKLESMRRLKGDAERAPSVEPDAESIRKRLDDARYKWRIKSSALEGHNAKCQSLQGLRDRLLALETDIATVSADLRVRNIAVNALSPNGIPADIARESLDVLEDRANLLLEGCGLSFRFAWDRQARGLEDSCSECGYPYRGQRDKSCPSCSAERAPKMASELEILVDDGSGVVEDVRFKSGGAQVLVASSIRLAAGAMLRDFRGSPMAFALVDEPFGALDACNRKSLAVTFSAMLDAVGLQQTFVVSHDVALLDALPHGVEVVRDGARSGVSTR